MLETQGKVGAGGQFHFVRTDTTKIKGSGPDGQVLVSDIWEQETDEAGNVKGWRYDEKGHLIPKVPEALVEQKVFHNKFTKRGLAYFMYGIFNGTGSTVAPAEVQSPTIDPYLAFVLLGDTTAPVAAGDQRVEWDESDTLNVTGLPAGSTLAGEGRRGITVATTVGLFRRLSTSYVGTNPYGILEYIFFAQSNAAPVQTGDTGLDNFPIKGVALAAGVDCGDGEANSKIGVRAIVGLAPTFQGVSDRVYVHESHQQSQDVMAKEYTSSAEVAGVHGYVQSSKATEVQIGINSTPSGSSTITAATRTIVVNDAATMLPATSGFQAASHVRKVFRVTTSGAGNDRDYVIQEVVNATTIKVFETPASDETGVFTSAVFTTYEGYNLFDGRVANEGRVETSDTGSVPVPSDSPGSIVNGEDWNSVDSSGPHMVGRIFAANQTLAGVRLTVPAGVNKNFVPDAFRIQYLDPAANGGSPRPANNADWVDITPNGFGSPNLTSQATNLFDAGFYGLEYAFSPVSARGIRIDNATAFSSTRHVKLSQLYAYVQPTPFVLSGNTLGLKVKSGDAYKAYTLPDVASTTDVSELVTSLNTVLRGWQLEAVRSEFGYLWIRGTVAGDNSSVFLEEEAAAASRANTELGLPTGNTQRDGITQAITKQNTDALTLIYRVKLNGDVPGGYA